MSRREKSPKVALVTSGDEQSLGERVYALVKQEIRTCVLAPGSSFSEGQLAERYAVSKAPVRWALAALSHERLVAASPRQGYTVAPVTLQSVRELFDIREILEPAAARGAAGRANIVRLEELNNEVSRGYTVGDRQSQGRFFEANKEFHVEIARGAGNSRLTRLIEGTLGETERIFYLGLRIPRGTSFMAPDHRGLIEMLAAGRGDEAARIATEHVARSRTMMLDAILDSAVIQTANIAVPA